MDDGTQKNFKTKVLELLIEEEKSKPDSNALTKNLLKYLNENNNQEDLISYLSLPSIPIISRCLEFIVKLLIDNKSLYTKKHSENILLIALKISHIQGEIQEILKNEGSSIDLPDFQNFLAFCLSELLFNEVSIENDLNFNSFSKYFKLISENFNYEQVSRILKSILDIVIEKIEEKNLVECCKTLKKTFLFIFPKVISFPSNIDISWFGNSLLSILKKFFYYNKTQKESKNQSGFFNFFNKIGLGSATAGEKSPMVKGEIYDKMSKKDKNSVNDFKSEFQLLLRKNILFEINRNIEIFKENNQEELIVDRLREYEENEKIIFDEEFENTDFYNSLLYLFGKMMER